MAANSANQVAMFRERAEQLLAYNVTRRNDESAAAMNEVMAEITLEALETANAACDQQYMVTITNERITAENREACQNQRQEINAAYIRGKSVLRARLRALEAERPAPQARAANEQPVVEAVIRREPRVGKFNGDHHAWRAFRDMFLAEVHNRPDLEGVAKLSYLKSACIGKASDTLGMWSHTNDSYAGAWALLNERYDDAYSIKQSLMQQITLLPILKSESSDSLNHMVNTVQTVTRQLRDMNVNVDSWDPMMIHLLMSRLPHTASNSWEEKRDVGREPILRDLLAFISSRARGRLYQDTATETVNVNLQQSSSDKNKNKFDNVDKTKQNQSRFNKRPPQQETEQVEEKKKKFDNTSFKKNNKNGDANKQKPFKGRKCEMCQGEHWLSKCQKFREVALQKRIQLIDQWHLCRLCLGGHAQGECKWTGCLRCNGSHHVMNCPLERGQVNLIYQQSLKTADASKQTGAQ